MSARSRPLNIATGHCAAKLLQGLGRAVDKRGRVGIRDDLRQRPVVVETDERLPAGDNADQLTVGVERVWKLRYVFVTLADLDVGKVVDHDVGTACAAARRHRRCGSHR